MCSRLCIKNLSIFDKEEACCKIYIHVLPVLCKYLSIPTFMHLSPIIRTHSNAFI